MDPLGSAGLESESHRTLRNPSTKAGAIKFYLIVNSVVFIFLKRSNAIFRKRSNARPSSSRFNLFKWLHILCRYAGLRIAVFRPLITHHLGLKKLTRTDLIYIYT